MLLWHVQQFVTISQPWMELPSQWRYNVYLALPLGFTGSKVTTRRTKTLDSISIRHRSNMLLIYSFIYSFIYLFNYLFIYLFIYSFIYLFINKEIYIIYHLFILFIIHSFIYLFIYCNVNSSLDASRWYSLRSIHWHWCKRRIVWAPVVTVEDMCIHNDVIKWTLFPRYCPFVRGIHRSPVNSPHKGQWRGVLMFS